MTSKVKQISFYIAVWKEFKTPQDTFTIAYAVAHDTNNYEIKTRAFPTSTPTYDAWMTVLGEMLQDQFTWYLEFGRGTPTVMRIITHSTLTKNETSSMRSLFGVYKRYKHVVLTPSIINDATQLVVKGRARTQSTGLKQEMLTVFLKSNAKHDGLEFKHQIINKITDNVDSQRFMTVFERARGEVIG